MYTHNAISMLNQRAKILRAFLEATKAGKVPRDHAILRRIATLVNQLPAIDSAEFKQEFISVCYYFIYYLLLFITFVYYYYHYYC